MRGLIRESRELYAGNENKINTVIVGPNPILCESLARYLRKSQFQVIARTTSLPDILSVVLPRDNPLLVIIDTGDNPSDYCGEIHRLVKTFPQARIAVLATLSTSKQVTGVLKAGAHGYLASIATCDDFIKSLELLMNGQTIFPSECFPFENDGSAAQAGPYEAPSETALPLFLKTSSQQSAKEDLPGFSERELHVLRCLVEGSSNKVIARTCDISEGTVKVHVKAILRKLKVKNRTQAAMWAVNHRWIVWPAEGAANYLGTITGGLAAVNVDVTDRTAHEVDGPRALDLTLVGEQQVQSR